MSIRSREIGWSQESNLLWQILKQLNRLTSVMFGLKPKYKVFTGLVTQSGGDQPLVISNSPLTIGVTYRISSNDSLTADFTNVGAPNNNTDTMFIATGTTPTSWGETSSGELTFNTATPTLVILENTLGNVWAIYNGADGNYLIQSNGLFTDTKTFVTIGSLPDCCATDVWGTVIFNAAGDSGCSLLTYDSNNQPISNQLAFTPLEIRVYN